MTYTIDLFNNKLRENKEELKEKVSQDQLLGFLKNINHVIKNNLETEKENETAEKKNAVLIYTGLVNFYEKLVNCLIKNGIEQSEKVKTKLKSVIDIFEKVVESFSLTKLGEKVKEMKEKMFE